MNFEEFSKSPELRLHTFTTFISACIAHAKDFLKSGKIDETSSMLNLMDDRCTQEKLGLTVEGPELDFSELEALDPIKDE